MNQGVKWIVFALAALAASCATLSPVADGSGTETTTGCTAAVVYTNGSKAGGAYVRIRPSNYFQTIDSAQTSGSVFDTVTDHNGIFSIRNVQPGNYVIEVSDGERCAVATTCTIIPNDSMQDQGTWILKPYAQLSGTVDSPATSGNALYVAVQGLQHQAKVGPTGGFWITDMPEGTFEVRVFNGGSSVPVHVLDNIKVASGGTFAFAVVGGWRYSRVAYLNTTASGAGVSANVPGFPVVFRLNASNFNFGQAQDSGQDLRFTKANGTQLPYEIEAFDGTAGKSDVWVKLDTVLGNADVQPVIVWWGNPSATTQSSGPTVFDTMQGFQAVWHLNAGCSDATVNHHDGTNFGAADTEGILGWCKKFSGADSIRIGGLLGSRSILTLSAWAQSAAVDTSGYEILSLGGNVILRLDVKQTFSVTGLFHVYSADTLFRAWAVTQASSTQPNNWHFISYSFDDINHVQSISVDGNQPIVRNDTSSVLYSGIGINTYIGSFPVGSDVSSFIGNIDEVRVDGVVRPDSWRMLCYMNQKPVDALVTYK